MKKIKMIIDIVMYLIFIVLMGHHITGNLIHEILGSLLFILIYSSSYSKLSIL